MGDVVRIINELAVDGCMPDVTFLMELSPEIGKSRISEDNQDRLEQEKLEFHDKVYAGYKEIAKFYPSRFVEIDAGREKEIIRDIMFSHLDKILEG